MPNIDFAFVHGPEREKGIGNERVHFALVHGPEREKGIGTERVHFALAHGPEREKGIGNGRVHFAHVHGPERAMTCCEAEAATHPTVKAAGKAVKGDEQPNPVLPESGAAGGSPTGESSEHSLVRDGPNWEALSSQAAEQGETREEPSYESEPCSKQTLLRAMWDYDLEDQLIFEVVNITSATTNRAQTLQRQAAIVAFQEHSVDGKEAADFKQGATEAKREVVLGPLDPELGRKTAGVGFSSRKGLLHMPIKAVTRDYDDAVKTGRLLAHQWELQDAVLQVGSVYGWTGGIKGSKVAGRTNDLLAILANEFDSQEAGPKMIVGPERRPREPTDGATPIEGQGLGRPWFTGAAMHRRG